MNVLDVIRGQVTVQSTEDRDRYKNLLNATTTDSSQALAKDDLALSGNIQQDLVRIQELQNNYLKNEVSLGGLQEMQSVISDYETQGVGTDDWAELSGRLSAVSRGTQFAGENVISYMSTNIEDEKSLYTLKMNLGNEIQNYESRLASNRREIAGYLITRENQDVQSGFDPEVALSEVISALNPQTAESLHGPMNNVNSLLSEG